MKDKIKNRKKIKKISASLWSFFRAMLFIGLGFVLLYPILYMLSIAFRPVEQMSDPSVIWIPKSLTLQNFREVSEVMDMPGTFFNSVIIAVGAAVLQVASTALTGYALARFRLKECKILFFIVLFSIIVPAQTLAVPTYLIFKNFSFFGLFKINLLNTMGVYLVPAALGMGIKSGLFIFVFRQFFKGLPTELEEAAKLDGCGVFGTFTRIMLPLSTTSMLTIFIFSVVWHWNDYYYGTMYMSDVKTIATSLATLKMSLKSIGVEIFDPYELVTRLQSGCFILIVPVLILYIFVQKKFIEGVERTGITG